MRFEILEPDRTHREQPGPGRFRRDLRRSVRPGRLGRGHDAQAIRIDFLDVDRNA